MLSVSNTDTRLSLGDRILHANRPWSRAWGLLGRSGLAYGEGLWIDPCNSIHMWFMRLPLDVLFLDPDRCVVGVFEEVAPWRMIWPVKGARTVLELPVGTIKRSGTRMGHQLAVEPTTSPAPVPPPPVG